MLKNKQFVPCFLLSSPHFSFVMDGRPQFLVLENRKIGKIDVENDE